MIMNMKEEGNKYVYAHIEIIESEKRNKWITLSNRDNMCEQGKAK